MPAQIQFLLTPGPDGTGNSISVSASGYTVPSTIAIYVLALDTDEQVSAMPGISCVATESTIEQSWPTPSTPVPGAAYIATIWNAGVTPAVTLPMSALASRGFPAWGIAPPTIDSAESEAILNAGVQFGERIQTNGLKRSENSIPTVEEAVQELIDLGVPASYFSAQARINLGELLNDLEQDPAGAVSPKAGAWSCWACKVGFGIVILAIVAAIVVILMIVPGGPTVLASSIAALLHASSIAAVAANSMVLGGAIAATVWVGGTAAISSALLAYIPNKLCELTSAC